MNRRSPFVVTILVVIIGAMSLVASAQGWRNQNTDQPNGPQQFRQNRQQSHNRMSHYGSGQGFFSDLPEATNLELTEEVIAAMVDGIMDEYNAYNTYQIVMDQLGTVRPFVNIQRSEAQHIRAWEFLFDRYDVEIPDFPEIDTTLTFDSLSDACQIAVDAEIANFELYDQMLTTLADYPDIVQVIIHLRDASENNHLVAFTKCAS